MRRSHPEPGGARVPTAIVVAGLLVLLLVGGCGSIHQPGESPEPTGGTGMATVKGHVSWPDCVSSPEDCPRVEGTPVHFADAAANRTFTAVADNFGGYSIQVPAGSYVVIAGHADRSPYQRQITIRPGDSLAVDLTIALPTG
jgi:hypothetical protein